MRTRRSLGPPGDGRVDDRPLPAEPEQGAGRRCELLHLGDDSGSPWRATCQWKENSASVPSRPSTSSPSRGSPGLIEHGRGRQVAPEASRPEHVDARCRSAATPSSSRLTSSSVSREISSGTARASSRSRTGHASAAARSAMVADAGAVAEAVLLPPSRSRARRHRRGGAGPARRGPGAPAAPSPPPARPRQLHPRLSATSCGRAPSESGAPGSVADGGRAPWRTPARLQPPWGRRRPRQHVGTASRSPRTVVVASASSRPAPVATPTIVATAASSSASRSATAQCGPPGPEAGRTRPAATRRSPSTVASASRRALGDRSVRDVARASSWHGLADREGHRPAVVGDLDRPVARGDPGRRALPSSGSSRPTAAIPPHLRPPPSTLTLPTDGWFPAYADGSSRELKDWPGVGDPLYPSGGDH